MAIIRIQGNQEKANRIHYEFDTASEPLGEGGMGKVYRGIQVSETTGLTRDVAIKFMFDGLPKSVIDRARREASIQVHNENIVEMLGFIETSTKDQNGNVYMHYHVVSELLTGVMLADLLNGVTSTKNGIPVPFAQNLLKMYQEDRALFAVTIMRNVAAGIMALHDKGYIHRDIDPSNIMITIDGKIKIIDFGIAKKLPSRFNSSDLVTQDKLNSEDRTYTMTGQFIGKPQYAAPELVVGDVAYQNEMTDIYAMGILFYQLLVGKLPFSGPVTKVLDAQKKLKTPVNNITCGAGYRAVVAKATEKLQEKRYSSAAEFRVALDRLPDYDKTVSKNTLAIIGGSVVGLIAIVGMVFYLLSPKENINDRLYNADTAHEAWQELEKQSDADALFLQSRIYFDGVLPDSIVIMQKNLKGVVKQDNNKAHDLLVLAHEKNPEDYRILFELGCDYYQGTERTVDEERNLDLAEKYFKDAMEQAQKANDVVMQNRIKSMLDKF